MSVLRTILLLGIFAVLACSKEDDNEPSDPFLDSWEVINGSGVGVSELIGTVYSFASDGGFTASKDGVTQVGTFTRTDTELTLDFGNTTVKYLYSITGNQMSWASTATGRNLTLQRR